MFSSLLQEEVIKKSPALLELGLLFETGFDEPHAKESSTFMSFQHKSFQDFTSSFFIKKRLEKTDNMKVKQCPFIIIFSSCKLFVGANKFEKLIIMLSKSLSGSLLICCFC